MTMRHEAPLTLLRWRLFSWAAFPELEEEMIVLLFIDAITYLTLYNYQKTWKFIVIFLTNWNLLWYLTYLYHWWHLLALTLSVHFRRGNCKNSSYDGCGTALKTLDEYLRKPGHLNSYSGRKREKIFLELTYSTWLKWYLSKMNEDVGRMI